MRHRYLVFLHNFAEGCNRIHPGGSEKSGRRPGTAWLQACFDTARHPPGRPCLRGKGVQRRAARPCGNSKTLRPRVGFGLEEVLEVGGTLEEAADETSQSKMLRASWAAGAVGQCAGVSAPISKERPPPPAAREGTRLTGVARDVPRRLTFQSRVGVASHHRKWPACCFQWCITIQWDVRLLLP